MHTRSTSFLTRLANVASIALALQLGVATAAMFTSAPLWLHCLLLCVVALAVLSFPISPPARAPWLPDAILTTLCVLQQVLWLAFAPSDLVSTLPWSWALWLSASIVVTFRHGRRAGVYFALIGVLSYPLSLLLLGSTTSDMDPVALLVPVFLVPIPPMFDQLRRELDDLRATTISSAEQSALAADASLRLRSELDTRRSFAAFVHDNVLATLVATAKARATSTPELRELARRARAGLREFGRAPAPERVQVRELVGELEAIAAHSRASWSVSLRRDALSTVPAALARDFAAAFLQAAENSLTHAEATPGGGARSASLLVTDTLVEAQYRDHGPGFLLAEVPETRLGLRGSILHRIERHAGASAMLDSEPGIGTTVTLRWNRDLAATQERSSAAPTPRGGSGASALVAFWIISVVISLTTIGVQAHPLWTMAANVLVGAGAIALAVGMRLTNALTWAIASLPLLTSLLLLPQASPFMPKWQFTLDAASLLCAYLIVRGRVVPGVLGYASMAVVGLAWAWSHGGFHTLQGPRWLPTIMIGVALIWWWRLRRESAEVLAMRQEEARALRQADDASLALEGVERQRKWVEASAGALLEDIAGSEVVTEELRERARLAEARIRSRMRSPAFSLGPLEAAADAARERGASVSILDDDAAAGPAPERLVAEIVAHLAPVGLDDVVTIRRAPPRPGSPQRVSVFVQHAQGAGALHFVEETAPAVDLR